MIEWKVNSPSQGTKLIDCIKNKMGSSYSSKQIKRWIENNRCTVNGRLQRFASTLIVDGDVIHFELPEEGFKISPKFYADKDSILYENEVILIYNKPSGIACTDSHFLEVLKLLHPTLALIHRLDKDTSGALMLAKTESMRLAMITQFKEKKIRKKYLAIVDGRISKETGTIETYMGQIAVYQGHSYWGNVNKNKGVYAQTQWKMLQKNTQASLVECYPITGRTHQIRVHLAGIGHPILGDYHYGKQFKSAFRPSRCLLHASRLTFKNPLDGQMIDVEAPIPPDFSSALEIFKRG